MAVNTFRLRYLSTIVSYKLYNEEMKTLKNILSFEESDIAQLRLHVLQFGQKYGWEAACQEFNVSKTTYFRWQAMLRDSGGKLLSLMPKSTTPHKTRDSKVNHLIVSQVIKIRTQYGNIGKDKIKVMIDQYAASLGLKTISSSTIGRIIKQHQLYQKPILSYSRRKSQYAKDRTHHAPHITQPGYLEIDCVMAKICSYNVYFVTGVDVYTKLAQAQPLYSPPTSQATKNALLSFQSKIPYPIKTVQTDNGSEFLDKFHTCLENAHLQHVFTLPHSPKINGCIERFNRTLREEFLQTKRSIYKDISCLDKQLELWLDTYNNKRPHHSLGMLTPMEFVEKYYSQML